MSVHQEIVNVQQAKGFSFRASIEREIRQETGAKYPDKDIIKLDLAGNAETYEEASTNLKGAVTLIHHILDKPETKAGKKEG